MSTPDAPRVSAHNGTVPSASGPTTSPWLKILWFCLASTAAALVLMSLAALILTGPEGALSAVFGYAVVVLFFGISLLVGHFAGLRNPSGAIGLFAVTYAIKVVGFAALLFFLGAPGWLERTWFFVGAVATVVLWQIVELIVFSKSRQQLYNDPEQVNPTGDSHA